MPANDPYSAVDLSAVPILPIGEIRGHIIFKVETSAVKAFDAVVFRDHLVRQLFDLMKDEWHLGNDDRFIQPTPNDLTLALSPRDAELFTRYGWLV